MDRNLREKSKMFINNQNETQFLFWVVDGGITGRSKARYRQYVFLKETQWERLLGPEVRNYCKATAFSR